MDSLHSTKFPHQKPSTTKPLTNNNHNSSAQPKQPTYNRYPSPNVTRSSSPAPTLPNRSRSADRRRSVLPSSPSSSSCSSSSSSSSSSGPNTPLGNRDSFMTRRTNGDLQLRQQYSMWPSMRSLNSAFQSNYISIPVGNGSNNKSSKTPLKQRGSVSSVLEQMENSSPRAARWQPAIGAKVSAAKTVGTKTKKVTPVPTKAVPVPTKVISVPTKVVSVPTKVVAVPVCKGSQSPVRGRVTPGGPAFNAVGFIGDLKRGKRRPSQIEDACKLRLVYNKLLQWRFVNERNTEALLAQKENCEEMLYSTWNSISELRDSVVAKRLDLQELTQEEKMNVLLNDQILYLEEWANLEREHSAALSGSIGALKSSTLRVPVTTGTKANLHAVKNAVSSAVDVMQAMGSSVCSLIEKVENRKSLVSELCNVVMEEKRMLEEYRELLSMAAQLQVQESSLRAEAMQLRQ